MINAEAANVLGVSLQHKDRPGRVSERMEDAN